MPPMMTMTKASMMTLVAMPRKAVTSGAASTPPSAASAQPMPNTRGAHQVDVGAERMHHLGVLRDARISRPARVRSRNCQIATATTMPAPIRNSR